MTTDIQDEVRKIKQSFRLMMDGATAQSMRAKGLDYHLNWGASMMQLREKASEIVQAAAGEASVASSFADGSSSSYRYALAVALWKENVRECKILATMLMPPDEVLPEVVDIWMEQTPTIEIAEQATFNLYQHLPFAADKAFQWLASPHELYQLCGFHVFSRLFMQKREPNERGINEFLDQAICALQGSSLSVRKAAMQSLVHFADLGLLYQRLANSALRRNGFESI